MSMNNRKIAGFMSAESIYSLAFYIVMVAAIAGVGAGIMSKTATAKAVSAVSLTRANYQAEVAIAGYGAAHPTAAQVEKLSGGLAAGGVITGAGTLSILNRPVGGPLAFSINLVGITSSEVCKAVAQVGWGTWDAVHAGSAALGSATAAPSTAAAITSAGVITAGIFQTKVAAMAFCSSIRTATPLALSYISK